MMKHRRLVVLALFLPLFAACGGSAGDSTSTADKPFAGESPDSGNGAPASEPISGDNPPLEEETAPPSAVTPVVLQGTVSYERVPFFARRHKGLDYDAAFDTPARGVTVQALDKNQRIVATTSANEQGHYQFAVPGQAEVRIRVLAELLGSNGSIWDVEVRDNTQGNALFVLEGSYASTGDAAVQFRDLHAPSGWTTNGYTGSRSAAPFAILDSVYDALVAVTSVDPDIVLPPLDVYWSEHNVAVFGDVTEGHLGTSFFSSSGPAIYLLGAANNDSDEFDRGVVQHEFGHYLEDQIGRTETLGGSHSLSSKLDMRVAFGEAWGNVFAAIAGDDPLYRDSLGSNQSWGFTIDVEQTDFNNQGWFSEASVQALIYDLYDDARDGVDNTALGFKPIYQALTSDAYLNFPGFASVYPFLSQLKSDHPALTTEIDQLAESFQIYGRGWYGEGERNNGGSPLALPLYHQLELGSSLEVCSDRQFQEYNGLDVRRYVRVDLPETRTYDIALHRSGGEINRSNPQVRVFKDGILVDSVRNGHVDFELGVRYLSAGQYILEIYEQSNADGDANTGGLVCFDLNVR